MPSFNQTALQNSVRNGNGVTILVGDQVIGFGQSQTYSIDYGAESLYGIGSAKPQEVQQQKFGISVSLDNLELTPEGIAQFGYSATWVEVLTGNQLTFHSVDADGNALLTVVGAVAGNYSKSIPANQPLTESTSFQATDILGPSGTSLLTAAPGQVLTGVQALSNIASALGV